MVGCNVTTNLTTMSTKDLKCHIVRQLGTKRWPKMVQIHAMEHKQHVCFTARTSPESSDPKSEAHQGIWLAS